MTQLDHIHERAAPVLNGILLVCCSLASLGSAGRAQQYPTAEISNPLINVVLLTPDANSGYYRATRFDWAGVIGSLQCNGHEYFGARLSHPDPLIHNSIAGPVECFEADLGYAEAEPGGRFIRIGVGVLEKPATPGFQPAFDHTYKVLDPGQWRLTRGEDWIEFVQEIPNVRGHAYVYTKRIQLTPGKCEMAIHHGLKNTGTKPIETAQYNHNYFMLDRQPSGAGFALRLPFVPRLNLLRGPVGLVAAKGPEILVLREPLADDLTLLEIDGYEPTAHHHDLVLENRNTGAGVRIVSDRPLAKLRLVVDRSIVAPEPFIDLKIAPGATETWTTVYTFYSTKIQPSQRH